jgi:hypothetical protein
MTNRGSCSIGYFSSFGPPSPYNIEMSGWFMKFLMVPYYPTLPKCNFSYRKVLQKQRVKNGQTKSREPTYGQPSNSIPPGSWHDLSGTKNVFRGFGFQSLAFLYLIYQRLYILQYDISTEATCQYLDSDPCTKNENCRVPPSTSTSVKPHPSGPTRPTHWHVRLSDPILDIALLDSPLHNAHRR